MTPKARIIIDTDPGVDDILALLLALSQKQEDVEVLLLSVTYGNVPVQCCLRNIVSLFYVLEKELSWRKANNKNQGFGTLLASKPVVAVGPDHPLEEDTLAADHFHGADGLHGVHEKHPHLSPSTWQDLFDNSNETSASLFRPSNAPAHQEILRILRENPENTITIAALGPMTNLAIAAAEDPEAFLRVKEVVAMGGAVNVPGNITPVAEFNVYADAVAAARVFALTSPNPASTMPPICPRSLQPYPAKLPRQLKLTLFPVDITDPHRLPKAYFDGRTDPLIEAGSPLAQWIGHFMSRTFDKITSLKPKGNTSEPSLKLHDPAIIWYILTADDPKWLSVAKPEDLRIETGGQWSRGHIITDRRGLDKAFPAEDDELTLTEIPTNTNNWLDLRAGNQINRMVASPGKDIFAGVLVESIFS